MRFLTRPWWIGFALFAVWLGYVVYTFSAAYRARFEARFNQIQVGDSYERMVSLLGKPDYYCPIDEFDYYPSKLNRVAVTEIYHVGTWDFGVEFPSSEAGQHGPVTKTKVSEESICPGHDNQY